MALQKTPVSINFVKGIETKTDPYQLSMDSFSLLNNSVFTTTGRLTKRNGFANITNLPNAIQTNLTTLNDNLIATGSNLYAFNADGNQWLNKGLVQPVQLSTETLVRTSTSQSSPDSAIASNGLVCTVYVDSSGTDYYQISDSHTGQQIIPRVALEATATSPRVFALGNYFIVTYLATITGTPTLRYVAIPIMNTQMPGSPTTFSSTVSAITDGYDGVVANNTLYLAWSASAVSVQIAFLTATLRISTATSTTTGAASTLMSVTSDIADNRIYMTYYGGTTGFSTSFTYNLGVVMTPTMVISAANVVTLSSVVNIMPLDIFYETSNVVSQLHFSNQNFITATSVAPPATTGPGTPGATNVMLRSVGLASKPFVIYTYTLDTAPLTVVTASVLPVPNTYILINSTVYMLAAYGSQATFSDNNTPSMQPTYFLVDMIGQIYMRLAYTNGGGIETTQVLPSVSNINETFSVPYLFKDFLTTVNKGANTTLPQTAIYTQTGINLATFTINNSQQYSSEIAGALHLTGGQLWEYDGVKPVELGAHVWPEYQSLTSSATGGLITAQVYNYVFTYEWTDAAGNLHRSAPSIPLRAQTLGSTSTVTLNVPTLRLTSKATPIPTYGTATTATPNPVRIVGYRWSVAQQVFYQFTSVTAPTLNNPSVDFVSIVDTQSDAQIIGNAILYTTGGVIENIAPPASVASCLFNNRLWLVDAEDRNLLWYSKQVIEAVPVEMSDLLTIFVAPTSGAQGSTGPITALSAMDDKLIIFKKDAIYYINGVGPDNTGANSQYSDPVFITSSVGCTNPNSIVLMPNGLMFQSDKGIWLLGRDLQTNYIGSPVEAYNGIPVVSAQAIPTTNQVRFILNNNITLMYDYFVGQWGTHSNIAAVSGTLYQSYQTYLNTYGQVFQETPNTYLDGSVPVLMSFTTAWINLAGLQGFERFYFGYLLGTYYTPFTLNTTIAYDYNPSSIQNIEILPDNYALPWGGEAQWGTGPTWGGPGNVFEARFFPSTQKCSSFQVSITEVFDPSLGAQPGAGLSISGLSLIVGMKRGFRTQKAGRSFG